MKSQVYGEGTHFKIPVIQDPIIFDIKSRPRSVPVTTGSKGLPTEYFVIRFDIGGRDNLMGHIE